MKLSVVHQKCMKLSVVHQKCMHSRVVQSIPVEMHAFEGSSVHSSEKCMHLSVVQPSNEKMHAFVCGKTKTKPSQKGYKVQPREYRGLFATHPCRKMKPSWNNQTRTVSQQALASTTQPLPPRLPRALDLWTHLGPSPPLPYHRPASDRRQTQHSPSAVTRPPWSASSAAFRKNLDGQNDQFGHGGL